jgi:hypothetical protein
MVSRVGKLLLGAALVLGLFCSSLQGQAPQPSSAALNRDDIGQIVQSVAEVIRREYFDAELALRLDVFLRQRLADGRYTGSNSSEDLALLLTSDLYSLTRDKHLSVAVTSPTADGPSSDAGIAQRARAEAVRMSNAGVQRVEILPGNVGYLNITAFFRPEEARDAIADAMRIVRRTDALILDMRGNQGGSPDTMALLASYCFDEPGILLADVVPRSGETNRYATQAGISDRDGRRPVYVLVSARTWSAGEGFAYILQERRRAEIIGETTAGAANPGRPYEINATFYVNVPNGQVRSAVRRSNWEGTGVQPDVFAPAAEALRVAHQRALRQLLGVTSDGSRRQQIEQALRMLEAGQPTQ